MLFLNYRVELDFCRSLILRMGDFLRIARTNFCDSERLLFFAGNKFLRFSGRSLVQLEL